jgi:hypothetical protein
VGHRQGLELRQAIAIPGKERADPVVFIGSGQPQEISKPPVEGGVLRGRHAALKNLEGPVKQVSVPSFLIPYRIEKSEISNLRSRFLLSTGLDDRQEKGTWWVIAKALNSGRRLHFQEKREQIL